MKMAANHCHEAKRIGSKGIARLLKISRQEFLNTLRHVPVRID